MSGRWNRWLMCSNMGKRGQNNKMLSVIAPAASGTLLIAVVLVFVSPNHAEGISQQLEPPTAQAANGNEILLPDDAVRNLVRQAKVEQLYTVMQTSSSRGMQTMEQALADLVLRGIVDFEEAVARTTRVEAGTSLSNEGSRAG